MAVEEPSAKYFRQPVTAAAVSANTPALQPVSHTLMNAEMAICCPGSENIAAPNAMALSARPGST